MPRFELDSPLTSKELSWRAAVTKREEGGEYGEVEEPLNSPPVVRNKYSLGNSTPLSSAANHKGGESTEVWRGKGGLKRGELYKMESVRALCLRIRELGKCSEGWKGRR